jgi:broad specificity phosphatase PhoE
VSASPWVLLRHGESTANRAGIYSGWDDVPLTEEGRSQAEAAGRALRGRRFVRVLSSDLQRATRTASLALAAAGLDDLPVEQLPGLRERSLGEWQGQDRQALRRAHPERPLLQWTGAAPGGETLGALAHRVLRTLVDAGDPRGPTLLVAHGGVIRVLLGLLAGDAPGDLWTRRVANAVPIEAQVSPGTWAHMLAELPAA